MEFKSFELMAMSGVLGRLCEKDIVEYERCKMNKDAWQCKEIVDKNYDCIRNNFKVEPLCMKPFNDTRECLFKADGNILACNKWKKQLEHCMKDPNDYINFLKLATPEQKKVPDFDFDRHPGSLASGV